MFEIRYNHLKGDWCPWELWQDGKLRDAFTTEQIASDRKKLLEDMAKILGSY